jgi:crotonobetainyl-CoA:carnitine CoA-transferase CaiB-like acyl-CoA transferase
MSEVAPLAGLRILDLTRLLPGPAATMHLADFGADVIKVEDTGDGDYMRHFPPLIEANGETINPAFEAVNRNKRSIAIDLKSLQGRDAFLRLIDGADATIESFRPGTLGRLGLGWELLHARNPKLVLCSISGYGQDGPLAQAAGHDLNYLALAGVLDQSRSSPDAGPAIPSVQVADILGGTLASLSGLLMALLAAQRTGVGSHVDCAMSEAVLAHHVFVHAQRDSGLAPRAADELLTGGVACYRCYRTADGRWLAVGALEMKFWRNFCIAASLPELIERHWSLGEAPGSDAAHATIAHVARTIASKPLAEWLSVLDPADACVSPVLSPEEAQHHAQVAARGVLKRDATGVTHVAPSVRIGVWSPELRRAPRQGQHTNDVLREAGFSAEEIKRLRDSAAIR